LYLFICLETDLILYLFIYLEMVLLCSQLLAGLEVIV
jgi:hypothetical protein